MPGISSLEGQVLARPTGKPIGRVRHVLFHPAEPRVVGLEVLPAPVLYVVQRAARYVPLDQVEPVGEGLVTVSARPTMGQAAERVLGFSWDETVIWRFMPVRTTEDAPMGFVRDVSFSFEDGAVRSVSVSDGAAADVAVGTQRLAAGQIEGFDGEYVRVKPAAAEEYSSGGVAAGVGKGAAVAKIAAEGAARAAVKGAAAAARIAKRSELGKRAAGGWRTFADAFAEGMRDDDKKKDGS